MRITIQILIAVFLVFPITSAMADVPSTEQIREPILFEPNLGQKDSAAKYLIHGKGYRGSLFENGLQLIFPDSSSELMIRLEDSNQKPQMKEVGAVQSTANYFIGANEADWKTNIPRYQALIYKQVYPGIDWLFYENRDLLEYDFLVAPSANPGQIQFTLEGAQQITIEKNGDLSLKMDSGTLHMLAPYAYQCQQFLESKCVGTKSIVTTEYKLIARNSVGFLVGTYDKNKILIIDPKISYGSVLGGKTFDNSLDVTTDKKGNFFVVGYTEENTRIPGNGDAFIHKFSPTGALIFSTFFVGSSGESADTVFVSPTGGIFIGGSTSSQDFPIVKGFQKKLGGGLDGFILKLAGTGKTIIQSSYLGGNANDNVVGIVQGKGPKLTTALYIFGHTSSQNFPKKDATQQSFGGGFRDGFLSIVDPAFTKLLFSTYVGLDGNDQVTSMTLNPARGDIYLPVLSFDGRNGSFIGHFKPAGASSPGSDVSSIPKYTFGSSLVDGMAEVIGLLGQVKWILSPLWTSSLAQSLAQTVIMAVGACAPVPPATSCNDNGTLVFLDDDLNPGRFASFGGTGPGAYFVTDITASKNGTITLVGNTLIKNLPLKNPVQGKIKGGTEGFVLSLAPGTFETTFYSYLGATGSDFPNGVAVDRLGNILVVGQTSGKKFPVTANAVKKVITGTADGFVLRITK